MNIYTPVSREDQRKAEIQGRRARLGIYGRAPQLSQKPAPQSQIEAVVSDTPVRSYIRMRAQELGFSYEEIKALTRRRDIANARMIIAWEVKTRVSPPTSYPVLARMLGVKDHTTILYGVRKVRRLGLLSMEELVRKYSKRTISGRVARCSPKASKKEWDND